MPELVPRDRYPVLLGVLDRDRKAGLHVAHRLADVFPAERFASLFERVEQREREHLLDVGGRVLLRDPRKLVSLAGRVQGGVMGLLVEVQRGDVFAGLAVREAEDDLPSEPAWACQSLVENLRAVRGADEGD